MVHDPYETLTLFPTTPKQDEGELPPFDWCFRIFYFLREPHDEWITVILADGNSYECKTHVLERYLKMYGVSEDVIFKLCGYIWNFNSVMFDRTTEKYVEVPQEVLIDGSTGRIRSPFDS